MADEHSNEARWFSENLGQGIAMMGTTLSKPTPPEDIGKRMLAVLTASGFDVRLEESKEGRWVFSSLVLK